MVLADSVVNVEKGNWGLGKRADCPFQSSHATHSLENGGNITGRTTTTHASKPSTNHFEANTEPVVNQLHPNARTANAVDVAFRRSGNGLTTTVTAYIVLGSLVATAYSYRCLWFSSREILIPHTGDPAACTRPPCSCSIPDSDSQLTSFLILQHAQVSQPARTPMLAPANFSSINARATRARERPGWLYHAT